MVGGHEVAAPSNSKKLYSQMTSIQAVFGSTYHKCSYIDAQSDQPDL